jgi:hypothetical protein
MMGGAWYEKYIGDKDEKGIYDLAFGEIKKHLSLKTQPDHYHLSILKVASFFFYYFCYIFESVFVKNELK